MATLKAANKTKIDTIGSDKAHQGDQGGKVKHVYDSYTLPGVVLASADIIELFKLPENARVLEVIASGPSLGTTGIIDIGWAAGADSVEAADANGFISALDLGGAAAIKKMTDAQSNAGYLKKFEEPVVIQAVCTEVSTATAVKLSFSIHYVID